MIEEPRFTDKNSPALILLSFLTIPVSPYNHQVDMNICRLDLVLRFWAVQLVQPCLYQLPLSVCRCAGRIDKN